jgi:hypothetical protein
MNLKLILYSFGLPLLLGSAGAFGQAAPSPIAAVNDHADPQYSTQGSIASAAPLPQGGAVSYASVTELNGLLAELEATSKATQADLTKLRIDRWKTDGSSKKRSLTDVDSIQRNLQGALPEMILQLRGAPEDLTPTFKLYRNLDTLDYVLGGVVESTGAFGSKDDLQALSNDLEGFDKSRKAFADRMENLAASKEQEIVRLRTELKTAQAAIPAAPPKKTVVDDNEPAKKPAVKKKPVVKKPAPAPGTAPATTPPAQTPPAQPKPQ